MGKSPEYPDLTFVLPKSWTNANRSSVQLIVIHTTEGSARGESAEDGAAYDARRTDGTSTHYFHDSNSTVQCVVTEDIAHTAKGEGNRRGIHHELCTRAGSAKWDDSYHEAMLRKAAKQAARDARKWDIPIRRLSPAEVKAGMRGLCGHADITAAFGQSTHTDPGKGFPWPTFIVMVAEELAMITLKENSMLLDEPTIEKIADRVVAKLTAQAEYANGGGTGSPVGRGVIDSGYPRRPGEKRQPAWSNLQALQVTLDEVLRKVTEDDGEYRTALEEIDAKVDTVLGELETEPIPPTA